MFGRIVLDRPADAADAVAFLRCRGAGLHGEIQTDAEHTRVTAGGKFSFVASLTFPTTERCYVEIRHPRYLTKRVYLEDRLAQTVDPVSLQSWDEFFAAGPTYELNPGSHRPWPDTELHRHLLDTLIWLKTFNAREQHGMARYIPDIHQIYTRANAALAGYTVNQRDRIRSIHRLEEMTAYPYPYLEYVTAVKEGDAKQAERFISGGVLRPGPTSMLYIAASGGHLEVMDVLLDHDEPIDVAGCYTPTLGAISKNQWPALLKLLRAGASLDTGCRTNQRRVGDVFSDFARGGQLEYLKQFLDAGVPVDLRNQRDTTALVEATVAGRTQAVKLLLAAGADPHQRTTDEKLLVSEARSRGFLDIERVLQIAVRGQPAGQTATEEGGTAVALTWRLREPQPYRVHTSFGQVRNVVADPQHDGVLWLATWGGLLRVAPASGEQRSWTMADGLPANTVYKLWFDPSGKYLWLATSGGLARLKLADLQRIETISGKKLRTETGSGFIPGDRAGQVWYWSGAGLYRLTPENSIARHYPLRETVFGVAAIPGSTDFFISDNSTLWRFDPARGAHSKVLDAGTLAELSVDGPSGSPQLRQLNIDPRGGYLWIDSFRHGVFRMNVTSGAVERPLLSATQLAECARTRATPHMYGRVTLAGEITYARLGRCFGRIDPDNRFTRLRGAIHAGPVADAQGDSWYIADDSFYRIDAGGSEQSFPRGRDALDNAQIKALEHVGGELRIATYRSPVAVLDLKTRAWSRSAKVTPPAARPTGSGRRKAVDPDVPGLTWGIHSQGIYLSNNGRLIQRWPAQLPDGVLTVTRDEGGTTLWIATNSGLIEFPVAGSPDEWLAEPAEEAEFDESSPHLERRSR